MKKTFGSVLILLSLALLLVSGRPGGPATKLLKLDSLDGLDLINTKAEIVNYRGRRSVHFNPVSDRLDMVGIIQNVDFKDGTIELEVAGAPLASTIEGKTGPSVRAAHVMAYDSARQRVVLFGGGVGPDRLGDTWEWDGKQWVQVK